MAFTDSLRGYAYPVHRPDCFRCQYCGLDGTESFDRWLCLSSDHLLPKGHPRRDDHEFIVTACMFCNVADNQYFVRAGERGRRGLVIAPERDCVLPLDSTCTEVTPEETIPASTAATGRWL